MSMVLQNMDKNTTGNVNLNPALSCQVVTTSLPAAQRQDSQNKRAAPKVKITTFKAIFSAGNNCDGRCSHSVLLDLALPKLVGQMDQGSHHCQSAEVSHCRAWEGGLAGQQRKGSTGNSNSGGVGESAWKRKEMERIVVPLLGHLVQIFVSSLPSFISRHFSCNLMPAGRANKH